MKVSLAELIAEYIEKKTALDKAKSNCESSWGYYLYDGIKEVENLSEQINESVRELAQAGK